MGFVGTGNLSVIRSPPETACVAKSLGLCQIGLAPPELLSHKLVFGNVQGAANELLQALVFGHRSPDAANVSDLAIRADHAFCDIEGRGFHREPLDEVRHELPILWVDTIQVFLNSRRFAVRIEAVHPK